MVVSDTRTTYPPTIMLSGGKNLVRVSPMKAEVAQTLVTTLKSAFSKRAQTRWILAKTRASFRESPETYSGENRK